MIDPDPRAAGAPPPQCDCVELRARVDALENLVHKGLRTLDGAVRANTKTLEIIVTNKPAFEPERPGLMRRIFG